MVDDQTIANKAWEIFKQWAIHIRVESEEQAQEWAHDALMAAEVWHEVLSKWAEERER